MAAVTRRRVAAGGPPPALPAPPAVPLAPPALPGGIDGGDPFYGPYESGPDLFKDKDMEDLNYPESLNFYMNELSTKAIDMQLHSLYNRNTLESIKIENIKDETLKNSQLLGNSQNLATYLIYTYERILEILDKRIIKHIFMYSGTKYIRQDHLDEAQSNKTTITRRIPLLKENELFIRRKIQEIHKLEQEQEELKNEDDDDLIPIDPTTRLLVNIAERLTPSSSDDKMQSKFMNKTYETASLKEFFDLKNQPKIMKQFNTKIEFQEWLKKIEIQFRANSFTTIFINNNNLEDAYKEFSSLRRVDELKKNQQWTKIVQREFLNFNTIAYTYLMDCLTHVMVESLDSKIKSAVDNGNRKRIPEILNFSEDIKSVNKNFYTNYYDLIAELQSSYGIIKQNEISYYLNLWSSIKYIPYENPIHFYERLGQARAYMEKIDPSWKSKSSTVIGWEVLKDKIPSICDFKSILSHIGDVTMETLQIKHQLWYDGLDDFRKHQRIGELNDGSNYEQKASRKTNGGKRHIDMINASNDNNSNNNNNSKSKYPYPQALRDKLKYLPSDEWKRLSSDQQRKNIEQNRRTITEYFKEHPNERVMGYSAQEKSGNKFMKKDKNKNQKQVSFADSNENNSNNENYSQNGYNKDGTLKLDKPRILMLTELDSPIIEESVNTGLEKSKNVPEVEEFNNSDDEENLNINNNEEKDEFLKYATDKGWSFKWILDSGATLHAVQNHHIIDTEDIQKFKDPVRIETLGGVVNSHAQVDVSIHKNVKLTGVRIIDSKNKIGMNIMSEIGRAHV